MKVFTIYTTSLPTNTYVISNYDKSIVVDPGGNFLEISNLLQKEKLTCKHVLLTHGHFDHCNAAKQFQLSGAKIYMHKADMELINSDKNLSSIFGIKFNTFIPDVYVEDGQILDIYDNGIEVIYTPGHTVGGVCYKFKDCIFSGDTLFYQNIGRTDFPTGDSNALSDSIKNKLFSLIDDYKIYPGHDRCTNLKFEKENNPYV